MLLRGIASDLFPVLPLRVSQHARERESARNVIRKIKGREEERERLARSRENKQPREKGRGVVGSKGGKASNNMSLADISRAHHETSRQPGTVLAASRVCLPHLCLSSLWIPSLACLLAFPSEVYMSVSTCASVCVFDFHCFL